MKEDKIGVGRRKRAVASVILRRGKGKVDVNGSPFETYFPLERQRNMVVEPLNLLELIGDYDLILRLKGGGLEAQAVAARLGIARAIVGEDEERRSLLKEKGFLTRDPRKKERKKYGRAKARKKFQFSKR